MKRASIAAATLVAWAACAADFPSKPIRIIVPNPPGGTVDLVARTVAPGMSAALGQPIIVDIKTGGNSIIGTEAVARASADGHTMLMAATHLTLNPLLRKLPYDGLHSFAPVALLATTPNVIAVNPAVPAHSVAELLTLAKAKPLNVATSNLGSGIHLAAERFKQLAGIDVNYVPYQGGVLAVQSAVAGHTPVAFAPLSDAMPHIASGKLRALAVTSSRRVGMLPDVPTLDESGFAGFRSVQWFGIVVPSGTPKATVARLGAEAKRAIEAPAARALFEKVGITVEFVPADGFADFLRDESAMFTTVLREVHITVE